MLQITIPGGKEQWDSKNERFIVTKGQVLTLEHSLVSVSKWESKWHKYFLSNKPKTNEETIDYIRCMTLTQNVDPNIFRCLTNENVEQVKAYIDDPMTATRFSKEPHKPSRNNEQIASETIYYWMIALNIPFECQKWHLNRLLTLIEVCNRKNKPAKKMSRNDILRRNSAVNAARRKKYNSKG